MSLAPHTRLWSLSLPRAGLAHLAIREFPGNSLRCDPALGGRRIDAARLPAITASRVRHGEAKAYAHRLG
jgi:hypothetical protein